MIDTITAAIDFIYRLWPLIAAITLILVLFLDKKQLDVKLDGVAKFIAALVIIGLAKICIADGSMMPNIPIIKSMRGFLFVFLEDAFFAMIPYYICKKINSKTGKLLVWVFFSLFFAYGHIYLGLTWAIITSVYPFFISYRYAMKTSFATVMACHFIYDCFVFLLPKINNLLSMI